MDQEANTAGREQQQASKHAGNSVSFGHQEDHPGAKES